MPILFRDYETRSTLNLKRVGSYKYAQHQTSEILCCAYAVDDGPVQIWLPGESAPPEFVEAANNPDWVVSAFNDQFERHLEAFIMGPRYGFPVIPLDRHRCTQAAAHALALPGSLAKAADALALDRRKDKAGEVLMKKMCKPRKPKAGEDPNGICWHDDLESRLRLYAYCKQDVVVERALYTRIGHLPDSEQAIWKLDQTINDEGIPIDRKLVAGAVDIGEAAQAAIDAEMCAATGGQVSTAKKEKKLLAWLQANGTTIENVRKETVAAALNCTDLPNNVRRALELRRDGAHIAATKFKAMEAWCAADGRLRGAHKYCGAGTGRWTAQGVQTQNLKKTNGLDIAAAIEMVSGGNFERMKEQYDNPLSVVGELARAAICAAPGHRLIAADFSGVESRVLAWLADEESKLDLWRQYDKTGAPEDDVYFRLGKQLGFPDDRARSIGKIADLAFGFCGGEGAYRKFTHDNAASEEIEKLKRGWRDAHPKTTALWRDIEARAMRAVANPGVVQHVTEHLAFCCDGSFLRLTLPSGRPVSYPFPRLELREERPGETVLYFKDNARGKFVDCNYGKGAWRGLWVENVVQAVARDLLAGAMQRLEAAGYKIIMHVHDEIVAEVPDGFGGEQEFCRIVTERPEWAKGLPIAAKVRAGPRFVKTQPPETAETPDEEESDADMPDEAVPFDDPVPWFTDPPPTAPNGRADPGSWANEPEPYNYASGEREWGDDVEEYIYKDQHGRPYLKIKRTSNKQFPQYHYEGGRWIPGAPPGPKIPYRLPELLATPDAPVFVCEGEKDANNVAAMGLVATTNSGGAGKWAPELNLWFAGRKLIYALEDNDQPGRDHARTVARALIGCVGETRIVSLPGLKERGDVSDWLEEGHTKADLLLQCEAAPPYKRGLEVREVRNIGNLTKKPPPRGWLLGNAFCRGFVSQLLADGGVGKTSTRYAQYLSPAAIRELTGERVFQRCRVLILSLEDGIDELERRLFAATMHYNISHPELDGWVFYQALGRDAGKIKTLDEKGRVVDGELAALIEQTIVEHKIDLVGIDPFVKTHDAEENNNSAIDAVVQVLTNLAEKHDIAVDLPHHVSKGPADPGNAQKGRGASSFVDAGRLVYTLTKMSAEEAKKFGIPAEECHYYVRMDKGKVNILPPARVAKWFKLVGVPLHNGNELYPNGDEVQTVEFWLPPEIWENLDTILQNRILDTIEEGLPDGRRYSDSPTAKERAAWEAVLKHAPDKNKEQSGEIIKAWVKTGVLESKDYEDPTDRKTRKGLFVAEKKRPT